MEEWGLPEYVTSLRLEFPAEQMMKLRDSVIVINISKVVYPRDRSAASLITLQDLRELQFTCSNIQTPFRLLLLVYFNKLRLPGR